MDRSEISGLTLEKYSAVVSVAHPLFDRERVGWAGNRRPGTRFAETDVSSD
jgi:hypothetical protein